MVVQRDTSRSDAAKRLLDPKSVTRTVSGGDIEYFKCPHNTIEGECMEVILKTDGLPHMANIQLWQGAGVVKQIAEVNSNDGANKPFRAVIGTPSDFGYTRTICIVNTGL